MSADLRTALREAVSDAPPDGVDAAAIIAAGTRRLHRRAAVTVGSCVLAVAAMVVSTAVMGRDRPPPDPAPAEIVHLDIDDSTPMDIDVVASTRTAWDNDLDSLEYDRLAGITADGQVLRTRYSNDRRHAEIGLLDPATGATDWLPPPPGRPPELTPVQLTADRLVLDEWMHQGRTLHVFDRATRTWQSSPVHVAGDWERHVPPLVRLDANDRVHVGTTMEGEPEPMHWWSAPLADGGEARPEPDLQGAAATWGPGTQLTAEPGGRVVLTDAEGPTVVAEERPADCERPADFPDAAPAVLLAGEVPVVTHLCERGQVTMVYRPGEDPAALRGVSAVAGDDGHVVLATARTFLAALTIDPGTPARVYVLDLSDLSLARVGAGPREAQVAVAAGLLLWNTPRPTDTHDSYDVVWNVARLD